MKATINTNNTFYGLNNEIVTMEHDFTGIGETEREAIAKAEKEIIRYKNFSRTIDVEIKSIIIQ